MSKKRQEWTYYNEETFKWHEPYVSREELEILHRDELIDDHTMVINVRTMRPDRRGIGSQGVMFSNLAMNEIEFDPDPEDFLVSRKNNSTTVFSGPNNGGKTLFLKHLYSFVGHKGLLVAANRFSNVDILNSRAMVEEEHVQRYRNFIANFESTRANTDDSDYKLDQIFTGLKDRQREKVFNVAEQLLGNKFKMVRTDSENKFSPFYVSMDGENLRYGSSGTRLLLTLLGVLMDEKYSIILLDEPEIGLSPRIQAQLARFLFDSEERKSYCPHVEQLYISTHSHIFLDRREYSNNFIVTKNQKMVKVREVASITDLHQLQFNMLGNELDSLFLPSAIIIVEGQSDVNYLNKILEVHLLGKRVAVVCAHGEGEVRSKLNFFKEAFGDVASSLYRARLFIVFDKQISTKVGKIENQGVLSENIIILSKNGIEYYYPKELMAAAFHCHESQVDQIQIEKENVEYNGHRFSKIELSKFVASGMQPTHTLNLEITAFVDKLKAVCQ